MTEREICQSQFGQSFYWGSDHKTSNTLTGPPKGTKILIESRCHKQISAAKGRGFPSLWLREMENAFLYQYENRIRIQSNRIEPNWLCLCLCLCLIDKQDDDVGWGYGFGVGFGPGTWL